MRKAWLVEQKGQICQSQIPKWSQYLYVNQKIHIMLTYAWLVAKEILVLYTHEYFSKIWESFTLLM